MPNLFPENAYILLDGETEKRYADENGSVIIRSDGLLTGIVGGINSTVVRFSFDPSFIDTENDVLVEIPIRTFILHQDYGELSNAYIKISGETENRYATGGTVSVANGNMIYVSIMADNCKQIDEQLLEITAHTQYNYTLNFQFLRTFNILLDDYSIPTNAYIKISGETENRYADEFGVLAFRTSDAISGYASSSDTSVQSNFNYSIITGDTTHNIILYKPFIFADPIVQAIVLTNFDSNADGIITKSEIQAITNLNLKFSNITGITSFSELKYFDGLTTFNASEFNGNKYMRGVIELPKYLTGSTKDYIFSNCYALSGITIPSGVTSIGNSAFGYCYSLANITIPNGVTSIGPYAFQNCYSLQSITIPNSVTSIGNSAFSNCYSLQNINIPSGVTSIVNYAFSNCYSLANIELPSTIITIGSQAFQYCYSLQSITIPNSVTSIGNSAFSNCYSLQNINIPSGVTSIGNYAFSNCYSLNSIIMNSLIPPTITSTSFLIGAKALCKIYVPAESLVTYKTATNWSSIAAYIFSKP